jgi:O-antigen/teichoic acid export membrane protein
MEAFSMYDGILQGKGIFKSSAFYFTFNSLTATAALVLAIILTDGNFYAIVGTYFVAWSILNIISWYRAKRLLNKASAPQTEGVVLYGVQLTGIGLISAVTSQLDKVVLFHFLGPAQLAIYAFATALPEQLRNVLKNILPLALTRFSQRSAADIRSSIFKKAFILMGATAVMALAYIVMAPYIYELFFPAYMEAVRPSQLFALSLLFVPTFLYTAALQSQRAKKLLLANDVFASTLQIALLFGLVPFYGLWGAIWARLIGRYTSLIVASLLIKRL